jgi:hypothetical protein
MLQESTKDAIDALGIEELESEYKKGRYSKFQNEGYEYIGARLEKLRREQEESNIAMNLLLSEEANRIAKEANIIANESKDMAKSSYRMAIIAVIISLVAIMAQWLKS